MLTKTAVNGTIGMVKQSPFQHDLFDFKYIEDQVASIKKTINNEESNEDKRNIEDILEEQLSVLKEIQFLLTEINSNTKRKNSWFSFKD